MANIEELAALPGAKLARTRRDQIALNDIRIRLEDLIRFRLEPLIPAIRGSGLIPNVTEAVRFCEAQLAHDERRLAAAEGDAAVIRDAINAYSRQRGETGRDDSPAHSSPGEKPPAPRPTDTVTPVLTETFLEGLMEMTAQGAEIQYRQRLIDDYRAAAARVVPLRQAVTYDRDVIEQLRSAGGGTSALSAQQVENEMRALHDEVRVALERINELHQTISRNLNPETHMFVATAVPVTRTQRTASWQRLAVIGLLVTLLSIPLILAGVLIHNRLRQEEEVEEEQERLEAAAH